MEGTMFLDCASVAYTLAGGIVGSLVTAGIQHLFQMRRLKVEEMSRSRQRQKDAAAAVAEILGEWVRPRYKGLAHSSDEDRWRIQTTYWKNILLMDKDLFRLLAARLACRSEAPTNNALIVEARKLLLGLKAADICANELNSWPPEGQDAK